MKRITDLTALNLTAFFKSQSYLLPVMLLFYNENGLTVADFFFFQGIVLFAELLFGLPGGYIADRWQKKYILIFSYAMLLLRYSLWLFFRGYWIVLFGEICYAIYKSLFQSSAEGYIYQYLCDRESSKKNLSKYGKFNFASSMGSAVSALLGALIFKQTGIKIVLVIQIIIIVISILLLIFLKPVNKAVPSMNSYRKLFSFSQLALQLKNSNLKFYIITSSIFAATTSLLVNTFQPLLQFGEVPVIYFGAIYFFNHITRAFSSLHINNLINKLGMKTLSYIIYFSMFIAFASMFIIIQYNVSSAIIPLLIFICLSIALQLGLNISITSHLQEHTQIDNRSMMASVNNTSIRLCSSLVLFANTYIIKNYGLAYESYLGIAIIMILTFILPKLKSK